jgi:hypothetical protein
MGVVRRGIMVTKADIDILTDASLKCKTIEPFGRRRWATDQPFIHNQEKSDNVR